MREVDDVVDGTTRWFRMTLSRWRGSTGGRGRGNGMSRCVPGGGRCPRRIASSISSCSAAVIRNGGQWAAQAPCSTIRAPILAPILARKKKFQKKRTQTLFILCTNSPPILPPFFNLLSAAANIDVIDQMPCTICGGREVVRAPPNVVDDEFEVIRRRCDVDHRLETFRASPVTREKQRRKESVVSGVSYLFGS